MGHLRVFHVHGLPDDHPESPRLACSSPESETATLAYLRETAGEQVTMELIAESDFEADEVHPARRNRWLAEHLRGPE